MDSYRSAMGYPNVLGMVLAGGEGTRLHPLTLERAKPAVRFGGKYRIIDFVLNNFVNSGIFKIKVLTQFKSDSLIKHLSAGWNLNGMLGQYIDPVPAQMRTGKRWYEGTADAIFQNINLIEDENPDYVAIFGADHIYKMDISKMLNFHRNAGAVVTISAIAKPIDSVTNKYGIIEIDRSGRMIGFEEKPANPRPVPGNSEMTLVSMGNYMFNKNFLIRELYSDASDKESSHDFARDIVPRIYRKYPVYVFNFSNNIVPGEKRERNLYWEDVGTLEAYYKANMSLRDSNPEINLYNEYWPIRTAPGQSAPAKFENTGNEHERQKGEALDSIISGGCIISGGKVIRSVLSRGVRVQSSALVEDSILYTDVKIGENAKIRRAIIDRNAVIEPNDKIGYNIKEDRMRFFVSESGIVVISMPSRKYQN